MGFILHIIFIYLVQSKEYMIQSLYWVDRFLIFKISVFIFDLQQRGIAARPSPRYPEKHCNYSTVYN